MPIRYNLGRFLSPHCLSRNLSTNSVTKIDQSYVHSIDLKVCGRFARNHAILRPWFLRYIPKGGYPMRVNYVDTMPDVDPNKKTIVVLHNTPGSYYDFFRFIVDFGQQYRVIIPNLPNFSHTVNTGCFWHSAEEKSELVADLLRELGIRRVDCLVAHSMAIYPASYLWIYANSKDYFQLKSLCLLSPAGLNKFRWRDRCKFNLVTQMSRSLAFRHFTPKRLMSSHKSPLQNIFSTYDVAAWKTVSQKLSNYETFSLRLRILSQLQIPTTFIFSSNDQLITPNVYYDQLFELNANHEDFDIYEQYENNLIHVSDGSSWIRVVDFRSAGHYMFNTHSYLIHSYIAELLDKSESQS